MQGGAGRPGSALRAPEARYGSMFLDEELPLPTLKPAWPSGKRQVRSNLLAILLGVLIPWLEFTIVCGVLTYRVRLAWLWVLLSALVVLGLGLMTLSARRSQREKSPYVLRCAVFLLVTSCVGFVAGLVVGKQNNALMKPFDTFVGMGLYVGVDPQGPDISDEVLDAGRIFFEPGTFLDIRKSIGFKEQDMYCVAPVASNHTTEASAMYYAFWAVGVNCCPGAEAGFRCGNYNKARANAGLRLMNDGQRPYFRLAVQQAEAAYNIQAPNPIFLHWMEDPIAAVGAYPKQAHKRFEIAVWLFLALQVFFVAAVAMVMSRSLEDL